MPISFEEFIAEFNAVQETLQRDYESSDEHMAVCHMLHRDIGLDETRPPEDELEDALERIESVTGERPDDDILDLTVEHHQLHEWLRAIKIEAAVQQVPVDQLMATLLLVGRRLGMREAARWVGLNPDADQVYLEFEPEDDTPPSDRL